MNSALYVRMFSLNLIRDLIDNQCSDLGRALDSYLKSYLTQSLLGQGNSVHAAMQTCFIFFGTTEQQRITVVKATAH